MIRLIWLVSVKFMVFLNRLSFGFLKTINYNSKNFAMFCGSYSNSFIASSPKTSTIKMSLGRQRLKLRCELHHPTGRHSALHIEVSALSRLTSPASRVKRLGKHSYSPWSVPDGSRIVVPYCEMHYSYRNTN